MPSSRSTRALMESVSRAWPLRRGPRRRLGRSGPTLTRQAAASRRLPGTHGANGAPRRVVSQAPTGSIPRASDGLARAVHDHHDQAHVPVQADAARRCFDKVGVASRHVEDRQDRDHVARRHTSFVKGPPRATIRLLVALRG